MTPRPDTARGTWIAVLGPDGAGKSTVIEASMRELTPAFAAIRRFHLRPHFGRDTDRPPVTRPHAEPRRGILVSILKLAWWWLDYWTGYALLVRPALRRGELVIFDRYFWDLLVDPRRYRYGGWRGLARAVGRSIPVPEVIVVLDAPTDVLLSRKREVAPEEVERQRHRYRDLVGRLETAVLVDATRPVDAVTREVVDRVRQAGAIQAASDPANR